MNNRPRWRILSEHIIRSKTNDGEFCKQTFRVVKADDNNLDIALSIHKLVLTDDFEIYEMFGYENLKEFKNKRLYKQVFSIKLKTLNEVIGWINSIS